MLTLSKIKVLYCYLVCFIMAMYLTFGGANFIHKYLEVTYLEKTYIPSDAVKQKKNKQEAIETEKAEIIQRFNKDVMWYGPSLLGALLMLGIHIIIIKRTKES